MFRSTVFIVLVFTITIFSQQNKNTLDLSSDYQMKVGDYCALLLNETLKSNTNLDASIISTFDTENNTLDLNIFGGRGTVEGARETLNLYWNNIEKSFIPYVKKRFNTLLNKSDFRILYFNRTDGNKLILQLLNGQIVVPSN